MQFWPKMKWLVGMWMVNLVCLPDYDTSSFSWEKKQNLRSENGKRKRTSQDKWVCWLCPDVSACYCNLCQPSMQVFHPFRVLSQQLLKENALEINGWKEQQSRRSKRVRQEVWTESSVICQQKCCNYLTCSKMKQLFRVRLLTSTVFYYRYEY